MTHPTQPSFRNTLLLLVFCLMWQQAGADVAVVTTVVAVQAVDQQMPCHDASASTLPAPESECCLEQCQCTLGGCQPVLGIQSAAQVQPLAAQLSDHSVLLFPRSVQGQLFRPPIFA